MKIINNILLFTLVFVFAFSCKNEQPMEVVEVAPGLNTAELQEVATAYIQEQLAALGNPELTGVEVRDTMFAVEHFKREILIYNRGLADKDRRLNMARKLMNDAVALLSEEPNNEEAKANKAIGERKIEQIEENARIVDSLAQELAAVSEQKILYYELLLSYAKAQEETNDKPVNFMVRIAPDKTVLRSSRTRRKAGGKK